MNNKCLFERLGGRLTLEKVHKKFYDDIYADPTLSVWFKGVDQEHIEEQQTDFMQKAMGGDPIYTGQAPGMAHRHMFITEEHFQRRHILLEKAIKEYVHDEELIQKWLKIDRSFKAIICKSSIDDCEKANQTQEILAYDLNGKKIAS
ncbi:MAG: group 1 truncated hemoglobin [Bdellovibrionales bacterium]|jgi:hemoglobin|nr:group 1 truncated hemoglobin [Bdellovibrionales bacterium]